MRGQLRSVENVVFSTIKVWINDAKKQARVSSLSIICDTESSVEFDCDDVKKGTKGARADLVFTLKKREMAYVSHKACGFSHFGYGRIGNGTRWKKKKPHPELVKALEAVRNFCLAKCYSGSASAPDLIRWGKSVGDGIWFVPSLALQRAIVYGRDCGVVGQFRDDNVQLLAIGEPRFDQLARREWKLRFPCGFFSNPSIPSVVSRK